MWHEESARVRIDAYGTLFDVFSVTSLCDSCFLDARGAAQCGAPSNCITACSPSMMHRYKDFWELTSDGLVYAANASCSRSTRHAAELDDAYLRLAAFPDVRPGLDAPQGTWAADRDPERRT